ncbi:tail protein [Xanthomonas phage L522]|nr:tail protein [Xanthomonas phage L522]
MAIIMPKGLTHAFAEILSTSSTVAAITAANPAVATGTTADVGDVVVLSAAGAPYLNNTATVVGTGSTLLGVDGRRLAGTSSGVVRLTDVGAFTTFSQTIGVSQSGNEQGFAQVNFLEDSSGRQLSVPTTISPLVITLRFAYDPDAAYFDAAKSVSDRNALVVLRRSLPNGDAFYNSAYMTFNDSVSVAENAPMEVSAVFSCVGPTTLVRG